MSKRAKTRETKRNAQNRAEAGRKRIGRPPHVVTPETIARVESALAFGARQDQIADYLGIDDKTLRKRYAAQIRTAKMNRNLAVGQSLFRLAVGAPAEFNAQGKMTRAEVTPDVRAQIFWMKAQAGWREKTVLANDEDEDGNPKPFTFTVRDTKL